MKKATAILLAIVMAVGTSAALAESLELTGTIRATQTVTLTAPAAGKIEMLSVMPGDHVEADAPLASLQTTKIYAEQDGVVRIFGQPGDSIAALTVRYGGVAYVEPAQRYTISASTRKAYDADDNKLIHAGETVYLRSSSNMKVVAAGTVTAVAGSSYTVEVDGDAFESDTSVNIYRSVDYSAASKIGNGKVSQADAAIYTGSGYLVQLHVQSGQQVSAGDLLYETLEGSFAPGTAAINTVFAEAPGVIASVNVNRGRTVAADEALLDFYPDAGMRIVAPVPEGELSRLAPGMTVQFMLPDGGETEQWLVGQVEKISLLAEESEAYGATYDVYIIPEAVDHLRYGMTVSILIP